MAQKPLLIQVIHETKFGMAKPRPTSRATALAYAFFLTLTRQFSNLRWRSRF